MKRFALFILLSVYLSSNIAFALHQIFIPLEQDKVSFSGEDFGGEFGSALTKGDFDGDGKDDLVVGSPFASKDDKEWVGKAQVILASGEKKIDLWGENAGDQFGTSLAVGDFNGDGVDDLSIGAYNALYREKRPGKLYLLYGQTLLSSQSFDFAIDKPDSVFIGVDGGDKLSLGVSTLDVNNDGIDDLLIGAPLASAANIKNNGVVYVFFGGRYGFRNNYFYLEYTAYQPNLTFYGSSTGERFGSAIGGGDFNGDGFNDVLVGAYKADRLYYFRGMKNWPISLSTNVNYLSNGVKDSWFGFNFVVQDLNGDAYADILVSDMPYLKPELNTKALIYYGNKVQKFSVGSTIIGPTGDLRPGVALTTGDFNNDGQRDLVLGAPGINNYKSEEAGNAYVVYAAEDGMYEENYDLSENFDGTAIYGDKADEWFGSAMTALDFNGDGFDDLALSAKYAQGKESVNNGRVDVVFGDGHKLGLQKVSKELDDGDSYLNRAQAVSYIVESFNLDHAKKDYLDKCNTYKEFCLFNFTAVSLFKGLQLEPQLILYPDVQPSSTYYNEINIATMLGMVNGYTNIPDSPFYPEERISRIQALKVVLTAADMIDAQYKFEINDVENQEGYFNDVNAKIDHMWWYPLYLKTAIDAGILNADGLFRPDEGITLNELRDMVQKTLDYLALQSDEEKKS